MNKEDDSGRNDMSSYLYWQENGRYWHSEYDDRVRSNVLYPIQMIVLSALFSVTEGLRVAEFGCGTGRHLRYLKDISHLEVHGIDQSKTMTEAILMWSGDDWFRERIHIVEPLGPMPFDDEYFDIIFTCEALIHVSPKHINGRLSELLRISRLGCFHLEPASGVQIYEGAHMGSWNHQLDECYRQLARKIHFG